MKLLKIQYLTSSDKIRKNIQGLTEALKFRLNSVATMFNYMIVYKKTGEWYIE